MHLADEVGGHLAGAEARHLHLRRGRLDLAIDDGGDILGRDRELVATLEPLVQRLDSLHGQPSFLGNSCAASAPLAAAGLVRAKGLEPPHLAMAGPKPAASTSSATPASSTPGRRASIAVGRTRASADPHALQPLGASSRRRCHDRPETRISPPTPTSRRSRLWTARTTPRNPAQASPAGGSGLARGTAGPAALNEQDD